MKHKPGVYRLGRCYIIVSIDPGVGWHLSISAKEHLPSYNEIKAARYLLIPDEVTMAEIFPPKNEFVNVNPNCRHLFQIPSDVSTNLILPHE